MRQLRIVSWLWVLLGGFGTGVAILGGIQTLGAARAGEPTGSPALDFIAAGLLASGFVVGLSLRKGQWPSRIGISVLSLILIAGAGYLAWILVPPAVTGQLYPVVPWGAWLLFFAVGFAVPLYSLGVVLFSRTHLTSAST